MSTNSAILYDLADVVQMEIRTKSNACTGTRNNKMKLGNSTLVHAVTLASDFMAGNEVGVFLTITDTLGAYLWVGPSHQIELHLLERSKDMAKGSKKATLDAIKDRIKASFRWSENLEQWKPIEHSDHLVQGARKSH